MELRREDRDVAGLTVLALLHTGPRHTYDMHRLMVDWHKDFVTGLPRSMYHAVNRLLRGGLIEPVAAVRPGPRPERTVYALTEAGGRELRERERRLLRTPDRDTALFVAALSFLGVLPPEEAARALRDRAAALEEHSAGLGAELQATVGRLPGCCCWRRSTSGRGSTPSGPGSARSWRTWDRGASTGPRSGSPAGAGTRPRPPGRGRPRRRLRTKVRAGRWHAPPGRGTTARACAVRLPVGTTELSQGARADRNRPSEKERP
ncbi:PadR family transcriptional regulator [Nocardiopsis composta]